MRTMRNWMLGMTLVAGLLGTGAVAANAAPQVYQDGYADGYIPPCPGDGYVWVAGYYNGGYWVPGAWNFRGRAGWDRGYGYGYDRRPAFGYGARFDHQRDFRYNGRERGGERGYDRGGQRFEGNREGDRQGNRGGQQGGDRGGQRGFNGGQGGQRGGERGGGGRR